MTTSGKKQGGITKYSTPLRMEVVNMLTADLPLAERHSDHLHSSEWQDHRALHIKPDLILIYRKSDDEHLHLVRLGSHSELSL